MSNLWEYLRNVGHSDQNNRAKRLIPSDRDDAPAGLLTVRPVKQRMRIALKAASEFVSPNFGELALSFSTTAAWPFR
jgi:hypothetical protein